MKKYKNSEEGGVSAFEISENDIILEFKDGRKYLYNYLKPGKVHVEKMKILAEADNGLTTYVNQHVRENYYKRIK